MKYLFLISLLASSPSYAIDTELQQAISFGEIKELNQYSPEIEKQLLVRLFQTPVNGDSCFKEAHGVCQFRYFISVSTFDEHPETNIFKLKTLGEAVDIKWFNSSETDTALIKLILNQYSAEALKNNAQLKNTKTILNIKVSPKKLIESIAPTIK